MEEQSIMLLIIFAIVGIVIFIVMVMITRWIFGIETITTELQKQSKLLAEILKNQKEKIE